MVRLRAEPYAFAFNSGFDMPARLVVIDADTWRAVWNQIYLRSAPVPPLPVVDFSKEMIVVVALGSRSTGGFNILLTGANELSADGTTISISSVSPGPGCITTQAFVEPVDIARVARRNGEVRFVEQSRVAECS
jgi:hypothetical protein